MAKNQKRPESDHPAHPFRNFLYFIYTLINALAFCLAFFFYARAEILYVIPCAAVVAVAVVVGLVNAMRFRKK